MSFHLFYLIEFQTDYKFSIEYFFHDIIIEFVDHLKRMGDSDMIIKDKKLSIRNKFASLS